MSKTDLSAALVDAGGGTRRKAAPQPVTLTQPSEANGKAPTQPSRAVTKPITVHFPKDVRDQLKILAVEQGITVHLLVAEAFNDLFAKYKKPEIAPVDTKA